LLKVPVRLGFFLLCRACHTEINVLHVSVSNEWFLEWNYFP